MRADVGEAKRREGRGSARRGRRARAADRRSPGGSPRRCRASGTARAARAARRERRSPRTARRSAPALRPAGGQGPPRDRARRSATVRPRVGAGGVRRPRADITPPRCRCPRRTTQPGCSFRRRTTVAGTGPDHTPVRSTHPPLRGIRRMTHPGRSVEHVGCRKRMFPDPEKEDFITVTAETSGPGIGGAEDGGRMGTDALAILAAPAAPEARPESRLFVGSEVGVLRRVLLHRPDLELQRLTPSQQDDLLFDDVLWVKRARQEHDAFADTLASGASRCSTSATCWPRRSRTTGRAAWLLDRAIARATLGRDLGGSCATPRGRRPDDGRRTSIGGLTSPSCPATRDALGSRRSRARRGFVLPPLPNHLFTRDTSCWIYGGVSLNPMAMPARRRETRTSRRSTASTRCSRRPRSRPGTAASTRTAASTIEGGDVLVIGNGAVLDRHGRAHDARRRRGAGASGCSRPGRRPQVIAVALPAQRGVHAPRHGHDDGRPRHVRRLPRRPRRRSARTCSGPARTSSARNASTTSAPMLAARARPRRPSAFFTTGGDELRSRAGAVGRRQQRARGRARRRRRLRAQRRHQHQAPQGRHRGHHDRRQRARPRPRRPALHELPARSRDADLRARQP